MKIFISTIFFLLYLIFSVSAGIDIKTPLEKMNYSKLSSTEDMMKYLHQLEENSENLKISIIGHSVQGRNIPALYFTTDKTFASKRDSKPVVLIFCQQHGNETSGSEAALLVAKNLLNQDKDILEHIDLIMVPRVNPDGAEMGQRRNANGMDLNRNHVILSEPESEALHKLFLQWMPEVTLDIHEYDAVSKKWINHGFMKDAEEMLGAVSNLNISEKIRQFSKSVFIPETGKQIETAGFTFNEYIVGSPFEGERIRYSTTNVNDGRQSMGIYNTLSFLIEGKRYGDLITSIKRRTEGQVAALTAFLKTVTAHQSEILQMVNEERKKLINGNLDKWIGLQMDYFPDSSRSTLNFPIFELLTWHHVRKDLENFEPLVKVKKSVQRPVAYLVPKSEKKLLQLLHKHQIRMSELTENADLPVEIYTIHHVVSGEEEDKPADIVDVWVETKNKKVNAGTMVIFLSQPAGNLIPLLLEPQSSWGIVTERSGRKYRFKEYLQEGREYPIFRLMKPMKHGAPAFIETK